MRSAALFATSLAGCTLALGYPSAGTEICGNHVDDDLNGLVDCDDAACDGPSCREDSDERCRDHRDNDGDGRRDQEDLGCWPYARTNVERCESVGPTTWASVLDDVDGWAVLEGSATIEPDPRDPTRTVIHLVGTVDHPAILIGPALAGGFEPASIDFEYYAGTAQTSVGVVVDGADLSHPNPDGLGIVTFEDVTSILGPFVTVQLGTLVPVTGPRWVTGNFTFQHPIGATATTFDVTVGGTTYTHDGYLATRTLWFPGADPGQVPAPLTQGRALRPAFLASGDALLGRYDLALGRFDPCRVPTDAMPSPPPEPVPQLVNESLVGIAVEGTTVCALAFSVVLGVDGGQLVSRRSDDAGITFGASVPIEASSSLRVFTAPMIAEASGTSAVVSWASLPTGSPASADHFELLHSSDCATWTREPLGLDPIGRVFAPALGYTRDASGYEVASILFYGQAGGMMVVATSPTGAAGTFTYDASRNLDIPRRDVFVEGLARMDVLHAGDDRALVYASDGNITALVTSATGWVAVGSSFLVPSGRVGTFDRSLVTSPTMLLSPVAAAPAAPSLHGLFAYSSLDCSRSETCLPSSAIASFEMLPTH
jgi:hypothetical protein